MFVCEIEHGPKLGSACTEKCLMQLERTGNVPARGVESKCDSFCVLVGCVEGILQIHKECVAVPSEVVLDIRVGELGMIEEVLGHEAD